MAHGLVQGRRASISPAAQSLRRTRVSQAVHVMAQRRQRQSRMGVRTELFARRKTESFRAHDPTRIDRPPRHE